MPIRSTGSTRKPITPPTTPPVARTERTVLESLEADALRQRVRELESALQITTLALGRSEYRVQDLLRRLYGPKSDKIDPAQLALLSDQLDEDQALREVKPPVPAVPANPAKRRKGGGRRPAPAHLPIERIEIDLPEDENRGLIRIREEITEEIDYRPSQFIRRHLVRPVYVKPGNNTAPVIAPLPPRVIPQAGVGPGLLAHLLVSKYVDHLPLNRQQQMAARAGVDLPRQKLGRWVQTSAQLLLTVHEQLAERIRDSGYVQADETPVKVLDPDRGGRAAKAWLWTYHAPTADAIVFDFHRSRGRDSPKRFFPQQWQGALQSDGYKLYASLAKDRPGMTRFGCMAHCRRKVADAAKAGEPAAGPLLLAIGKLYALEKQAEALELDDHQRAALRYAKARPILKDLQRRFAALQATELPQSLLGKAARYALNRWPELARYAKAAYGHVRIDNNPVERGIRPTKLGLRNWLFIGHPNAGWRSAVIYSIVGTCKLINVNPEAYLAWVLPKLAAATTKTTDGLLPHDFAKRQLD